MFWIVSLPQNFLLGIQLTPHLVLELLQSISNYQFPLKICKFFNDLVECATCISYIFAGFAKKVFAVGPGIRFYMALN